MPLLFSTSYATELYIVDGGTGSRTPPPRRRLSLITSMQTSLVRSTIDMILHLTSSPAPAASPAS